MLDQILPLVFQTKLPVPPEVQDMIGEAMADQVPPEFRPNRSMHGNGKAIAAHHAKKRREDTPKVLELRSSGLTINQVAEEMHRTTDYVQRILRENGITRPRGEANRDRRKQDAPQILGMLDKGASKSRIASTLGCSREYVVRVIEEFGA